MPYTSQQAKYTQTAMTKASLQPVTGDWHPADIVAALRKAGWSLRRLSVHHGYRPNQLSVVTHRPWLKGERLIAAAIGVPAESIWPSRWAVRAEREAQLSPRARAHRAMRRSLSQSPLTTSLDGGAKSAKGDF